MPSTTSPTEAAQQLAAGVTRNRDGYWILGDPNLGCQYCGDVTAVEGREGGKTVWYHPSTECCTRAIARQITWRNAELNRLNDTWQTAETEVTRLHDELAKAYGSRAADLKTQLDKASRSLQIRADGAWREQAKALGEEIARLRRKHAWLERQEAEASR